MKDKMCCFDGDKKALNETGKENLKKAILQLMEEGFRKFCFLQKSSIDRSAFAILDELKKTYSGISLGLAFPNLDIRGVDLTKRPFSKYDFFLTDKISFKTPTGWKIGKWNYYMIDCSDCLIYRNVSNSVRAEDTLKYAKSKPNFQIINIDQM